MKILPSFMESRDNTYLKFIDELVGGTLDKQERDKLREAAEGALAASKHWFPSDLQYELCLGHVEMALERILDRAENQISDLEGKIEAHKHNRNILLNLLDASEKREEILKEALEMVVRDNIHIPKESGKNGMDIYYAQRMTGLQESCLEFMKRCLEIK